MSCQLYPSAQRIRLKQLRQFLRGQLIAQTIRRKLPARVTVLQYKLFDYDFLPLRWNADTMMKWADNTFDPGLWTDRQHQLHHLGASREYQKQA